MGYLFCWCVMKALLIFVLGRFLSLLLPRNGVCGMSLSGSGVTISRSLFRTSRRRTTTMIQTEMKDNLIRISEGTWRSAALTHRQTIRELLKDGLTNNSSHLLMNRGRSTNNKSPNHPNHHPGNEQDWTPLDPRHPVYNFLIEYYGIKGSKGPRRLARWSPCPSLLLSCPESPEIVAKGILLEGASMEWDLGDCLHLRGAMPHQDGIVYSPSKYFESTSRENVAEVYIWYRDLLRQTLESEPNFYCHNLHEWAMQYHPFYDDEDDGVSMMAPPPSAKYQAHLPMRVDRTTINQVVEGQNLHCTHLDAFRYFAPAARGLNHPAITNRLLSRKDQLPLEQPACVHANMDLIKMALKLQPFLSSSLLSDALAIALRARRLDVAASPYNATGYGIEPIPIETLEGRSRYRREQKNLLRDAQKVRRELLRAYDIFLKLSFSFGGRSGHEPN